MASAKKLYIQSAPLLRPLPQLVAIDASGEKIAVTFQAQEDATIADLFLRYGARTGTPPTYTIGLQGVDTSGLPDGTYKGGGSPASVDFTPPADATWDATGRWLTLDNAYAATQGEWLAWVIEYSTGTIDGSNRSTFGHQVNPSDWVPGAELALTHNGTSWSKQTTWAALYGYRSATNTYGRPIVVAASAQITTTGHRSTAKFTLDAGWGDTFKVRGFVMDLEPSAGGTMKAGIWNDAGTELQAITFDTDLLNTSKVFVPITFSGTLATLSFGTAYRIGWENLGTDWFDNTWQLSEADDLKAYPGEGQSCLSTWDGSAWTDDTDMLRPVRIVLEDITEPSGGAGGGIILPRSMSGGLV